MWNFTAEIIAFTIACIILAYSRRSDLTPSLKNRIFQACLIITVLAIGLNISSSLLIESNASGTISITWVVTTLYFVFTPLISAAYFYYTYATISETYPLKKIIATLGTIPYLLYFVCILFNPVTDWIFYLDAGGGYHQGPLILSTYIVFYIYCLACFVLAISSRNTVDPVITRILTIFPLVAVVVIVIQQFFPHYILSGSAAVCSLLIVYLYLQNKQISIDFLTRIPNRQEFSKMLALEKKRKTPITVVIVSVNNFKFVNDKFGSDSGDGFLSAFASYLSSISKTPWLYRYSGDQFVALFEKNRRNEVDGFLEALQLRMDEPWRIEDSNLVVSCSIGIVECPEVASNTATIINALEYCVGESKKLGPNKRCLCTKDMVNTIQRRHHIADILRKTLAEDGFIVHFQPIWSIPQQQFTTAEALCRIESEELGALSPFEFIPIAEETGLIVDMTYQVLGKTCNFIKATQEAYPHTSLESVSINYSAVQFMQNDLAERTLEIITASGISPSQIKIEITESVLISNPEPVKQFILDMHAVGVRFCLDDYGTGYSNLSTMLELPLDIVKLDKSIVWKGAERNGTENNFLKHITASFEAMGSTVLAEGVETEMQSSYVEDCGCSLIQGYLYAMPTSAIQAMETIAAGYSGTMKI